MLSCNYSMLLFHIVTATITYIFSHPELCLNKFFFFLSQTGFAKTNNQPATNKFIVFFLNYEMKKKTKTLY